MTLRIARILGRANVGGPARTTLELTRRLREFGFETLLLVGQSGSSEGNQFAGHDDVSICVVPGMRRAVSFTDFIAGRRVLSALREFRPHIVHTHAAKAGVLGRRAALRLSPRPAMVHTYHGHILRGYFSRPVSAFFAGVERRLARHTDRLVAVSEQVARELSGRYRVAAREQFEVIENGIDLAPFRPPDAQSRRDARLRLGVRDAARVVLVPARLVPIKGHDLLFDAIRLLPASVLPLEVHCLGDGPLRHKLERAASTLREGVRFRFHGFRDDLPRVLPAADAVVLSSRNEGMPLALIDAMAAETPVVATAVGGVPDLITSGEHGLLAQPGDASSLAFALGRVLTDLELARRLARQGRDRVVERHTIDRVVQDHVRLYRKLCPSTAGSVAGDA